MLPRPEEQILLPPPSISAAGHALFIDFDGTLTPIVDRPDDVVADRDLIDLLGALRTCFDDRLTVISGRSIAQLDTMIGPIAAGLSLVGSHGAEARRGGTLRQPARAAGLDAAADDLRAFAAGDPGLIVEEKSLGVALHFRQVPDRAAEVEEKATAIGAVHGLEVQPGKMMIELRGPGSDKGSAVAAMMAEPSLKDIRPIMIGDDLTDEPGFVVAETIGGFGILVGPQRDTAASCHLDDVPDLRRWLWTIVEAAK